MKLNDAVDIKQRIGNLFYWALLTTEREREEALNAIRKERLQSVQGEVRSAVSESAGVLPGLPEALK